MSPLVNYATWSLSLEEQLYSHRVNPRPLADAVSAVEWLLLAQHLIDCLLLVEIDIEFGSWLLLLQLQSLGGMGWRLRATRSLVRLDQRCCDFWLRRYWVLHSRHGRDGQVTKKDTAEVVWTIIDGCEAMYREGTNNLDGFK
jgi:hypothetical protein